MEFKTMTAEEYRALSDASLEERRTLVMGLCTADECDVDAEALRSEARMIADEFARRGAAAQLRQLDASAVAAGAGTVVSGQQAVAQRAAQAEPEDPTSTVEYRTAFMDYVMRGRRSDALVQMREDQSTTTSDVGVLIPANLINNIIEKAETVGFILPRVTKTSFPVGQTIPVGSIKPVATWVAEGASSDRQKQSLDGTVTFAHYKLRCEVSVSMETSVMALSVFEQRLVQAVADAMTVAKEDAIINGDGSGKPKGILAEEPDEGQKIELEGGAGLTYQTLIDVEAAIPSEYEARAVWCMHKRTFMSFQGMTDSNGQPIARVNVGIGGRLERTLLGREVVIADKYMKPFEASPEAATTFAFVFDFADYVLNSNYDMGVQRKQDWDTEDWLTKAVTACDGKVIDKGSLVTLGVKATPGA